MMVYDICENGSVTVCGHPGPPDWQGMNKSFQERLALAWEFLLEVTFYPPYPGATKEEIIGSSNPLTQEDYDEVLEMFGALVKEGFIREQSGRYFIVAKRSYGTQCQTTWGGRAFTKSIPAEEYREGYRGWD